jgi:hypothetical protein
MQPQAARFPFRSKPEKCKRQRRRVLTGEPGPSRCAILDQDRRHEGPSMIERRPRAPVLRSMGLRAMAPSASSTSVRSIDSISNSRWYCFTSAFFGWVRISLSEGSSRSSSVATGPRARLHGKFRRLASCERHCRTRLRVCNVKSWDTPSSPKMPGNR